jgi:FkbM family methyltransferase
VFSRAAEGIGSAEALGADLARWCAAYDYRVRPAGGNRIELLLPHRPALPWHRPLARWRIARRGEASGAYEPVATAAFDFFAERMPHAPFLDIGAEIGYFARIAAAHEGLSMPVHAVEMNPAAVERLQAGAAELGLSRIRAHLAGMSDAQRGEREIWYSITRMFEEEPPPAAYRDPPWIRLKFRLKGRPERDRLRRARVRIDSVDALCAREGLRPGLVKMDIDGYEARALPGAMETLARDRPVLMLELHRRRFLAPHGATREGVVAPLFALGYSALHCSNHLSLRRNRFTVVGPGHPLIRRESTDLVLFV